MTRVPGSTSSLNKEKAQGRDIRVVYSPLDALAVAKANPDRQVIFLGVGFETTTPLVAIAIKRAKAEGLANFSVYAACKNMPNALDVLMGDPELKVDALILPGHVSTIIGMEPYRFLAEKYHIPGVIAGFEPLDNEVALAAIDEVFETCTVSWRGLGPIEGSGYRIREEFAAYDAMRRFAPAVEETREHKGCRCGDVLRGIMTPAECPLFRKACSPENPIGPCMISSEGSCAAYYRYY